MRKTFSLLFLIVGSVVSCQIQQPSTTDIRYSLFKTPLLPDRDSLSQFQLIEIADSTVCEILDSIINIDAQSIHHKNKEKTWFEITEDLDNDTIHLSVYSEQYDGFSINEFTNKITEGAFYYKGNLFILRKNENTSYHFFKTVSDSILVQYYYAQAKIYSCCIGRENFRFLENSSIHSIFYNKKLIRLDYRTSCPPNKWSIIYMN